MAASFGVDLGIQIYEAVKLCHQGKGKEALFHLGLAIVDALTLAGIVVGSWQLMLAAVSINITMTISAAYFSMKNFDKDKSVAFEAFCYFILAGVGVSAAFAMHKEISEKKSESSSLTHKETSKKNVLALKKTFSSECAEEGKQEEYTEYTWCGYILYKRDCHNGEWTPWYKGRMDG